MILITVEVHDGIENPEKLEIEHKPDTCTESDIDVMCYAIRRYLREQYGRAPFEKLKRE